MTSIVPDLACFVKVIIPPLSRTERERSSLRFRPPRPLTVPAPRGSPLFRGQHAPRLGRDHPREAPPVGDAAAVDVVLEVVALLRSEIDGAFPGKSSSQAWSSGDRSSSVKSSRVKPDIARHTALNSWLMAWAPEPGVASGIIDFATRDESD
jgi:hypothetical protein